MTKLRRITGLLASVLVGWALPVNANTVTEWNALATQCITLGATGIAASRPGPPGLLDFAIVQAAVHDAIQAIEGRYEPYLASPPATGRESVASAAAAAAHRVLAKVCPNYTATLDAALKPYLDGNNPGLKVGFAAGDALLEEYPGRTGHRPVHGWYKPRRMAADAAWEPADGLPVPGDDAPVHAARALAIPPGTDDAARQPLCTCAITTR